MLGEARQGVLEGRRLSAAAAAAHFGVPAASAASWGIRTVVADPQRRILNERAASGNLGFTSAIGGVRSPDAVLGGWGQP
jgi:hypothetical protein